MAEKYPLLTGPTRRFGNQVQLADGTVVDVAASVIYLDTAEDAAEVAHLIGLGHVEHGHPDDVEVDEETGQLVQRPFVYDDSHHRKHGKKKGR